MAAVTQKTKLQILQILLQTVANTVANVWIKLSLLETKSTVTFAPAAIGYAPVWSIGNKDASRLAGFVRREVLF